MDNVIDEARGQVIAALLYPAESSDTIMQTIGQYLLATGVPPKHVKNACNVMGSAISVFTKIQAVLTKCDCVFNAVTGELAGIPMHNVSGYNSVYCHKEWTKPWFNKGYDMVKDLQGEPEFAGWHHTLSGKQHILKIIANIGDNFGMFKMQLVHVQHQYNGRVVINKRWRREHLLASYAAWTGCGIKMGLLRDIRRLILQKLVAME